ncbi:co-chaperone DjlA [Aliikangiella sp. IMCC44653]
MKIYGKLICGILGALLGGPIGLVIGVWLGHSFDKGLNQEFGSYTSSANAFQTQQAFFDSTFAVMGHIAKADGVVSPIEIAAAEQVMRTLGLVNEKRQQAIDAFNRGKSSTFNLDEQLKGLITNCFRKPSLIQMFLEIQIVSAAADGEISDAERQILYQIGSAFNLPNAHINRLINMVIAQQSFHQQNQGQGQTKNSHRPSIEQAYAVLGISADADKASIKKAYRKLMSQHHPDKLVAKGMPQEMVKVATEKSQEIQAAYDMIKNQKGF